VTYKITRFATSCVKSVVRLNYFNDMLMAFCTLGIGHLWPPLRLIQKLLLCYLNAFFIS